MAFMVARTEKRKVGSLSGYQNHVDRKTKNHSNKDIDDSKTYLNYDLVGHESKTSFHEEFMGYINENRVGARAVRKDAVVMQDWIIGSSQEFFDDLNPEETRKYFETAVKFFAEKFGRENIRFATVHMDEKTPHMHMGIVPMKDGKLTAKTIFDRNCLRMIQNELPQAFQKAGFDIQRGEPKSEKVHLQPEEYKATMRAAQEKAKEITERAEKEAEKAQKELLEQTYEVWEEEWQSTRAEFDDFDLKLDPFNWDFDGTNPKLDREYTKTMNITVDEQTPRRFNFSFSQLSELFSVKYQALKVYIASKWQYLSHKEAEIEKRENTLTEKTEAYKSKMNALEAKSELKDLEFTKLDGLIETKSQLFTALSEEIDVSQMYPSYVKINKLTGNVTLPKDKWESRHIFAERVKDVLAISPYLSNLKIQNTTVLQQRMETATLKQENKNIHSAVYNWMDRSKNYEKVLENLIDDDVVTVSEIKQASKGGQLLPKDFKIKQGLEEKPMFKPEPTLGNDKGISLGM